MVRFPPLDGAGVGRALGFARGLARAINYANVIEALCGVVHDNRRSLHHGVREAVNLADIGGNLLLALGGVCCCVRCPDFFTVHGRDVRSAEVPADTYDAALEPVCRVYPAAPRANHPSPHDCLPFRCFMLALSYRAGSAAL